MSWARSSWSSRCFAPPSCAGPRRSHQSAGVAICSAILAGDLLLSWRWVRDANANGIGYSALQWRAIAGRLTSGAPNASTALFSNCPEGTYFVTGRPVRPLPVKQSEWTRQANSNYALELKQLQSALLAGGSAVSYYHCWERSDSSVFAALGASPVLQRWTEPFTAYQTP